MLGTCKSRLKAQPDQVNELTRAPPNTSPGYWQFGAEFPMVLPNATVFPTVNGSSCWEVKHHLIIIMCTRCYIESNKLQSWTTFNIPHTNPCIPVTGFERALLSQYICTHYCVVFYVVSMETVPHVSATSCHSVLHKWYVLKCGSLHNCGLYDYLQHGGNVNPLVLVVLVIFIN